MEKPEPPEEGECCGSGCSPCVWDTYYSRLEAYDQFMSEHDSTISSENKIHNDDRSTATATPTPTTSATSTIPTLTSSATSTPTPTSTLTSTSVPTSPSHEQEDIEDEKPLSPSTSIADSSFHGNTPETNTDDISENYSWKNIVIISAVLAGILIFYNKLQD
eukprot:TRINITY_DN1577_c2_g1_i2.p1 TRINITY_DN1577_c2_g1~~TRINITY_DN1577_c2_g1_i2.p1  ORF type:complete len:162 (-),score=63.71 TRINITY_DN1577_c2_g1_i2:9-494(-)